MRPEDIEVSTTGMVSIKSYAAIALNAPIHLMTDERAEGLIAMRPFREVITPVDMSGHDRHILQMALPSFITHGTVVWMVHHQPFDDRCAEGFGLRIINRNTSAIGRGRHAGHHKPTRLITIVF